MISFLSLVWLLAHEGHPLDMVIERPAQASSARLSTSRWMIASIGFDYRDDEGQSILTTPALLKWTLDDHWQLRLSSIGYREDPSPGVGHYLTKAELHTIEPGVRYRVVSLAEGALDAAIQSRVVGVDGAKQQWATSALFTGSFGELEWHLILESSFPLHARAKPRSGFGSFAVTGPLTHSLRWGGEWTTAAVDGGAARHYVMGALSLSLSPAWALDTALSGEAFGSTQFLRFQIGSTFALAAL